MRTDKLTVKNHEILEGALGLATKKGNPQIEPIHILAVLLQVSQEIARPVLGKLGTNQHALAQAVEEAVGKLPQVSGGSQPHLSQPAWRC
jgi:ATP-dependent Clp protease ATP-binding subunit ClpB